jgi:hypothetical protein
MTLSLFFANIGIVAILLIAIPLLLSLVSLAPFPGCISQGSQFLTIQNGYISNGISEACTSNNSTLPSAIILLMLFVILMVGLGLLKKVDWSSMLSFFGVTSFYFINVGSLLRPIPFLSYVDYTLLGVAGLGIIMALRFG